MTLTALAARDRSGLGGIGRGCGSVISAGSISDAIVGCTVIGVQPRELLILAPRRPSGRGPGASVARGVIVPLSCGAATWHRPDQIVREVFWLYGASSNLC